MKVSDLTDKSVEPTDEIVFSIIGEKKTFWKEIFRYLDDHYPGYTGAWKYYRDGNSWLFRTLWKKNTLFWIRVTDHGFKVAFYFSGKSESLIENSDLNEGIKEEFRDARKIRMGSGYTKCMAITPLGPGDVDSICKLIELKLK